MYSLKKKLRFEIYFIEMEHESNYRKKKYSNYDGESENSNKQNG